MRCEGWRRNGGMFTFGMPEWTQCENEAVVNLTIQQKEVETLPACMTCWQEVITKGIPILEVKPYVSDKINIPNHEKEAILHPQNKEAPNPKKGRKAIH